MFKIYQKTINSEVIFKGVGLHSGKISKMKLILQNAIKELFLKELI